MKRIRGIEKDPEYQRHYREALGEEKFARLWLPALGRWDIRVQTFFLRIGLVIAALAMAAIVATSARFTGYTVLTAVPLVALTGWALARWFGGANYPSEHRAGWLRTFVIWLIIAWVGRRLALMVLPDPSAFGSVERLFLAPFVIAVCVVIGARLHLDWWLTGIAGLFIAIAIAGGLPLDGTGANADREVAWTAAGQLTKLAASGDTVALQGAHFRPTPGLAASTRPARVAPRSSTECRSLRARDVRRTVLGLRGRTMSFRADVCWDTEGKPSWASFDGQVDPGRSAGRVRMVRAEGIDVFSAPFKIGYDGRRIGRNAFDLPASVADDSDGERLTPTTTLARVSRDGNRVELAYAVETRDPLVTGPSVQDESAGDRHGDPEGEPLSPDRLFSVRARDGYAIDLVTVVADRGSPLEAYLFRSTSSGLRLTARLSGPIAG